MFPIGQLTRFEVNNSNYRLLKPWWDVFTDYLSAAMLVVAVLAGLMQASNGNLVCLPAVDCHPGMNEDIQIKNVFMSEKNKEMVRDFVLCKEWPLGKLLRLTEDGGRTLRLTDLNGIPTTVFEITELDSLLLENCILTEEDFKRKNWANFHLRSLSLINCNLESIPDAILKQSSLKKLDLSRNRIKSIPAQIEELSNLETLNLASNKITSGQEHTWKMGQLRELSLRDNNDLTLDPNTPITLLQLDVNKAMVVNMSDKTWKVLKGIIVTTGIGQDVMVTKYSPDKCPHIESMRNNFEKVYKMTSNPKGLAIIISISRYDGLKGCRFKSEQDFNNLKNLFEGIGYTIAPLQEIQSKAELEKELKQCVQSIQESHESLILAVMSHGDERGLYLGNGETVKVEDIIRFIIVQSGHLEGKPKIVFSSAPKLNMSNPSIPSIHHKYAEEEKNEDATGDASHEEVDAPVLQDVIFAYSTVEGYASFRNTQGSWFINAIVDVFSKHAWEEDIVSLLTYVSYEVSRKLSFQGYKQIPAPQSTLTKKLFLLPGYFEDEQ